MKAIIITILILMGISVYTAPKTKKKISLKYWYMESGQAIRFTKIDSMQAQYDNWVEMYKADQTKYDSLKPLIDRNFRNWERAILDAEYHAYKLLPFN